MVIEGCSEFWNLPFIFLHGNDNTIKNYFLLPIVIFRINLVCGYKWKPYLGVVGVLHEPVERCGQQSNQGR